MIVPSISPILIRISPSSRVELHLGSLTAVLWTTLFVNPVDIGVLRFVFMVKGCDGHQLTGKRPPGFPGGPRVNRPVIALVL
jgi:hypothetical protein